MDICLFILLARLLEVMQAKGHLSWCNEPQVQPSMGLLESAACFKPHLHDIFELDFRASREHFFIWFEEMYMGGLTQFGMGQFGLLAHVICKDCLLLGGSYILSTIRWNYVASLNAGSLRIDNAQIFPATVTFVVNFNIVWLAPLEVLMKADCRWGFLS